jgi:hypothetical protein
MKLLITGFLKPICSLQEPVLIHHAYLHCDLVRHVNEMEETKNTNIFKLRNIKINTLELSLNVDTN